jgi:hypothetical protein
MTDLTTQPEADEPCPRCGATPDQEPNHDCPVCTGVVDA